MKSLLRRLQGGISDLDKVAVGAGFLVIFTISLFLGIRYNQIDRTYKEKPKAFERACQTIGYNPSNILNHEEIPDVNGDHIRDWRGYVRQPDGTYAVIIIPGVGAVREPAEKSEQ